MNPRLRKLFDEAIHENKQYHLEFVKEIFKLKFLLIAFRKVEHEDAVNRPGDVFDYYYDMTIEQLDLAWADLSAQGSLAAREQIGWTLRNNK